MRLSPSIFLRPRGVACVKPLRLSAPTPIPDWHPARSTNSRLERVFAAAPKLFNREFTVAVGVRRLWLNPRIESATCAKQIDNNIRVIVPPTCYWWGFARELHEQTQIQASPLECGRVLEHDAPVAMEGRYYVANNKGVGCTTFVRETSQMFHYLTGLTQRFDFSRVPQIHRYPFVHYKGPLDLPAARLEIASALTHAQSGIDAEHAAALYQIETMPDDKGVLRPVRDLQRLAYFPDDITPVILTRLSKTNFRLMDLCVLEKLRQNPPAGGGDMNLTFNAWIGHILEEYGRWENVQNPTRQHYLHWLIAKVVRQQILLLARGYACSATWQSLARNLSALGEELDLEDQHTAADLLQSPDKFRANFLTGVHHVNHALWVYGLALGIHSKALEECLNAELNAALRASCKAGDLGAALAIVNAFREAA